jgi:hypothetical protein
MPLALIAKIEFDPARVQRERDLHDFIHYMVGARFVALRRKGLSLIG